MHRGFTLVELMVVIAMLSVLAALALPDIKRLTQYSMEPKDVAAVRGFLAEARGAARRLNRCVKVLRVDERHLTWVPFVDGSVACPTAPLPSGVEGSVALTTTTLRLWPFIGATDDDTLIFLRSGGTPYGAIASVVLTRVVDGSAGLTRQLRIMPATGGVKGLH